MTSGLSLRVWDVEAGESRALPLALDGPGRMEIHLRGLAGASALHLELSRGGEVGHRFEVAAGADDLVAIDLEWTADDRIGVRSPGREVLSLPGDARYAPALPIRAPKGEGTALDLVLVIDATAQAWIPGESKKEPGRLRPLRGEPGAWREQVDLLVAMAETLADRTDLAMGVVAFGDQRVPEVRALELLPAYVLHPASMEASKPVPFDPAGLRRALNAIPPTSGGDFVDALADALARCAELPWRVGSRRVVLVVGDSPGYSLATPAPVGANSCVRSRVVETEADRLHRLGVEIATLYRSLPPEAGFQDHHLASILVAYAAGQYRALASRPGMAWELSSISPDEAARRLLADVPAALARGAGFPVPADAEGTGGAG